jgi:cell wall-associated NlpC family hydrolase
MAITVGMLAVIGCSSLTAQPEKRAQPVVGRADTPRSIVVDRRAETPPSNLDAHQPGGTSSAAGHAVARVATRYIGTPYIWGGTSPSGFDCSGFVRYVYARHGITLPRTVKEQYQIGMPVSRDRLRPGDIVFFDRLRHNGLYLGHARLIHASTLDGVVKIAGLDDDWFKHRWMGARRPLQAVAVRDAEPRN